jgi:hypothetical protein
MLSAAVLVAGFNCTSTGDFAMAGSGKQGGQRGNLSSSSGRKQRSETSSSHGGSRVDPSHMTERARTEREKKAGKKKK